LGAILDTPGLAERLLEALKPEIMAGAKHHREKHHRENRDRENHSRAARAEGSRPR
jgi:hypothetical protein